MYRSRLHVLGVRRTSSDKLKRESGAFSRVQTWRSTVPCRAWQCDMSGKESLGYHGQAMLVPRMWFSVSEPAALQRVDISRRRVKATDLSPPAARSGPEQGRFQPSTMIAVTNSTVKHAEHLHGDFRRVLPKQLWLYAVAPGVWLRQRWDRSYDLSPCKTSSLFMGEWKSADPKAFMLRESR